MGQGLRLALVGLAAGLAGAFALTRLMASLLFGVQPNDPATLVAVAATITARRGARVLHPGAARDPRRSGGRTARRIEAGFRPALRTSLVAPPTSGLPTPARSVKASDVVSIQSAADRLNVPNARCKNGT